MARRLETTDPGFRPAFDALLGAKREAAPDIDHTVRAIIADVRARGDAAVTEYTRRFDAFDPGVQSLRLGPSEIDAIAARASASAVAALEVAASRITAFHERQRPQDVAYTDSTGTELAWRWSPLESVGIYVPGGSASYPSSVLMNALPARVAGVKRIAMAVPAPRGELNPLVIAAARLCGVTEIWRMGGAQAVAALAYGTQTIAPVVKITGPGNAYVAAAKRIVFGDVGIDMIAGPSEIVVVADGANDPAWIAADLLSQAEHDASAQSILITDDADFAGRVDETVTAMLKTLPRHAIAAASWRDHGAIIVVRNLGEAAGLANELAPEHLELALADPDSFAARIHAAGAIFLGRHTPEAIGDYVAGPNHVLPTARSARFSSGLSVHDFMKRISYVRCSPDALAAIGPVAAELAEAEGLNAHGRSVTIRLNRR
ncbi:MAG TPA: histidinol dehydrogenase [Micropepsaceae bacterium]|nr:histidinol dehydrogenase [Micropepsaceae bacterium]